MLYRIIAVILLNGFIGLALGLVPTASAQKSLMADSSHETKVRQQYSTMAYLQQRISRSAPLFAVPREPGAVASWRKAAADKFAEMLGIAESEPVPLQPRVDKWQQRDGYRIQHVIFSAERDVDVPGWILVPDSIRGDKKAPAVLCIHGGVPGAKDEVAGEFSNPEARRGYAVYADDYARQFVKKGFVAFVIDLRNYGERREKFYPDPYQLNDAARYNTVLAMNALFMGQTFFGLHLFDCQRAIDYLLTRPEVDSSAIAAVGFSFGGNLAVWLAALDRRISAVGMEGNCPSWRRLMTENIAPTRGKNDQAPFHLLPGITCQMMPGFFRYLDMNISLALAAPTPMILCNEYQSWAYKDLDQAQQDAQVILDVYHDLHAADEVRIMHVTGGHRWHEQLIVPWISEKLLQIARKAKPRAN